MAIFRDAIRALLAHVAWGNGSSPSDRSGIRFLRDAEMRAARLLADNLSAAQLTQYERWGYFDVIGGNTGRHYRVRRGVQLNVDELDRHGRPIRMLCFLPDGRLPISDMMLSQKLALELYELDALAIANHSPVWDPVMSGTLPLVRRYRRW